MERTMNRKVKERSSRLRRVCQDALGLQIVAWIVVLTITLVTALVPYVSFADQSLPVAVAAYRDGTITVIISPTTFQIDGRTYSLTPDAVILDDGGNQLDVGMLAATLEVKYHVKKDQNDKIDRMIIFLPR
jgi:hypothetical protein